MIDAETVAGGLAIGVATSRIFGLLPIVQAANIRPLNVIRDLPGSRSVSSVTLTIALLRTTSAPNKAAVFQVPLDFFSTISYYLK